MRYLHRGIHKYVNFSQNFLLLLCINLLCFAGMFYWGFPGGWDGKESACNAGDLGSIPGLGRSPGGGHGNPLQYSCLENPMDREVWSIQSIGLQRVRPDWNYLAPMQVIIIKYHLSLVTFLSHCMNTSSFIFSLATYLCL